MTKNGLVTRTKGLASITPKGKEISFGKMAIDKKVLKGIAKEK